MAYWYDTKIKVDETDKVDRIILLTERYNMEQTKANTEVSEFKIIDDESVMRTKKRRRTL